MTGNTNEEIFPFAPILDQPLNFGKRQAVFAKVHAAGALGKRNVKPIIHQDSGRRRFSWGFCYSLQSFVCQGSAILAGKILLPNLDPIDACFRSGSDFQ